MLEVGSSGCVLLLCSDRLCCVKCLFNRGDLLGVWVDIGLIVDVLLARFGGLVVDVLLACVSVLVVVVVLLACSLALSTCDALPQFSF